ncbi:hypothetical protein C0J52_25661 [Blattella germanica]|nr:hypothetical protein C0J52_25661 [Blattella germanica]
MATINQSAVRRVTMFWIINYYFQNILSSKKYCTIHDLGVIKTNEESFYNRLFDSVITTSQSHVIYYNSVRTSVKYLPEKNSSFFFDLH